VATGCDAWRWMAGQCLARSEGFEPPTLGIEILLVRC
jgi:hypothetical protein